MSKKWSDDYLIGISELDEQHKKFFDVSQKLYDDIFSFKGEETVEPTLKFLQSYTKKHFQTEEAYMARHGYPHLESHKKLHDNFTEELGFFIDEFETYKCGSQEMADRIEELTTSWLLEHISDEDTQFVKYVKKD